MKKKGVSPPTGKRRVSKSCEGALGAGWNPQAFFDVPPKNLPLPPGAMSEEALLNGVPRIAIRQILGRLKIQVRWGRMKRMVVRGTVYYYPVREAHDATV